MQLTLWPLVVLALMPLTVSKPRERKWQLGVAVVFVVLLLLAASASALRQR